MEYIAPHSPLAMLDNPSKEEGEASDSGDDSGKEFKLAVNRRPNQSSSKLGSDPKRLPSAASNADLDLGIRRSSSTNTAMQVKKSGGGKSPKTEKRRHKAMKRTHKLNPDYISLLNDDIKSSASRGCEGKPPGKVLVMSRAVMGSIWTRYENNKFFSYLSIVGKDNLSELARGVGTKSIVECHAYLKTLRDEKNTVQFFRFPLHRGRDFISAEDIPAAVELSDECVKALEQDADYLEHQTQRHEESKEKAKWGDSWLLDPAAAEHIEHLYRNKCIKEIRDIAPEAELLNLGLMLDLSERYVPRVPNPPCQSFCSSALHLMLKLFVCFWPLRFGSIIVYSCADPKRTTGHTGVMSRLQSVTPRSLTYTHW